MFCHIGWYLFSWTHLILETLPQKIHILHNWRTEWEILQKFLNIEFMVPCHIRAEGKFKTHLVYIAIQPGSPHLQFYICGYIQRYRNAIVKYHTTSCHCWSLNSELLISLIPDCFCNKRSILLTNTAHDNKIASSNISFYSSDCTLTWQMFTWSLRGPTFHILTNICRCNWHRARILHGP